jgi:hypothetical protein
MLKNGVDRTADNTARCMPKATDTHNASYLLLFDGNSGYANAHQNYVDTQTACVVLFDDGRLGNVFEWSVIS